MLSNAVVNYGLTRPAKGLTRWASELIGQAAAAPEIGVSVPLPHTTMQVKLTLEWDARYKKWRLTWSLIDEHKKSWSTHWQWAETDTALDALDAFRLADAVCREMESWLPW